MPARPAAAANAEQSGQLRRRNRHHDSRGRLGEERRRVAICRGRIRDSRKVRVHSERRVEAAFSERHGHAAFDAIVRRTDHARCGSFDQHSLKRGFAREIQLRRHTANLVVNDVEELASAQLVSCVAKEHDDVAFRTECASDDAIGVLDQPDDSDDRRRQDTAAIGFVVQADVAARDRECRARDRLRPCLPPHDRTAT